MRFLTVNDVCNYLGYDASDPNLATDIENVGEVAEDMVEAYLGAPIETSNTESIRLFDGFDTGMVSFGCYCRSISKIEVLDQENNVAYEITDYVLQPSTNRKGVYRWVERKSDYNFPQGLANIRITGLWGFSEVPNQIKYATVLVIKHLFELRTHSTTLSEEAGFGRNVVFRDMGNDSAIPAPAKQILNPWVNRTFMVH